MNSKLFFTKFVSLVAVISFGVSGYAENVNLGGGNRNTNGNTNTSTGSGSGGSGSTPTSTTGGVPPPTGSGSYNGAASSGRGQANLNAAMSGAAGWMMVDKCLSTTPVGWGWCAMGAISFVQGMYSMQQARKAANIQGLTGKPGEYCPECGGANVDDPSKWDGSGLPPDQTVAYKKLVDMGYVFKKDGSITAPDGKNFSAEDFADKNSMMAAGISAADASSIMANRGAISDAAAKLAKDATGPSVVSMGVDSGGGGGRSPASDDAGSDTSFDDYLKRLRNPFGMNANQKQQMLAGKSLSHGSDQIGVKEDDIFKMVHRRYQERRAGDDFIEVTAVAAGGASAAAPTKALPRVTTPKGR